MGILVEFWEDKYFFSVGFQNYKEITANQSILLPLQLKDHLNKCI